MNLITILGIVSLLLFILFAVLFYRERKERAVSKRMSFIKDEDASSRLANVFLANLMTLFAILAFVALVVPATT